MRISIQFIPSKRWDIEFGYTTKLFSGMYWFCVILVDLDQFGNVEYASLLINWFKHPKYWFNNWGRKPIYAPYELKEEDLLSCCEICGALNGEHWRHCPDNPLNN